eukprot:3301940-Pyramimonas_sp.AAC.1
MLAPLSTVGALGQGSAHLQPPSGAPWVGEVCVLAFPPGWARRPRFWVCRVGAPSRWRAFTSSKYRSRCDMCTQLVSSTV